MEDDLPPLTPRQVRGGVERSRNPWLALPVLCFGLGVILLDTTIVSVAIPTLVGSLHAGVDQALWVVNAFFLTFAALLVVGGRLGDVVGQRNLFAGGLALFAVASALCGQAQDANQLIAARALQGVGAAALTPQTTALISALFPPSGRGAAFGTLSALGGIAGASGPIAGGLIVTYLSWRWIFLINVPIGAIGIALTFWLIPDLRTGRRHRLDLMGALLATAGMTAVVFGLIEGQRYNWGAVAGSLITIDEIMAVGVCLLGAFLLWERAQPEPLIPLALFRSRNFSLMVWLMALMNIGLFGMFIAITLELQSALGFSAIRAGWILAPVAVGAMVAAPVAGRLTDRVGSRAILAFGFATAATATAVMAALESPASGALTFALPFGLFGIGMGCVFAPVFTEGMREVQAPMAGAASGVLNTSRQLGSAIGAAAIGAVLQNRLAAGLHTDAGRLLAGVRHDVFASAFTAAMHPTLAVAVAILVLGIVSCGFIRPRPGAVAAEPAADAVTEMAVGRAS